jgi:hypothetical protein
VDAAVGGARAATPGVVGGDSWYEGDHGLFLMHGRPAVALTSADAATLTATVTHTAADRRELVDEDAVERTARFVDRLIRGLQAPA